MGKQLQIVGAKKHHLCRTVERPACEKLDLSAYFTAIKAIENK